MEWQLIDQSIENGTLRIADAFAALDEVLTEMRKEEIALEDSFELYQTGLRLVKYLNGLVDGLEKRLIVLQEGEAATDGL